MNQILRISNMSKLASVQHFFSHHVAELAEQLAQLETEIDGEAVPRIGDDFHRRVLAAFTQSQTACREFEQQHRSDPTLIQEVQQGFRQETDRWFSQSWIANRSRTKPSGFAGDFEMLIKLYEEATPARGIGGYLDLCILDLPLAQAVRARMVSAREFLLQEISGREGDVRILDIACGPCREFGDWPEFKGQHIEVVAMDNDPIALDYVESRIVGNLPPSAQLRPVRYNALRTRSAETTTKKFGKFDIIYSVGLCDYLTDEHLVGMFSAWNDTLENDGVLLIAFKDTEQYDHTPYQWHLDWFFYQRTVDDVLRLYNSAGIDTKAMTLTRDTTGIITNYISRRQAAPSRRFDAAEQPGARPVKEGAKSPVINRD